MKQISRALLVIVLVGGFAAQAWEERQDQRYFRECRDIDITLRDGMRVHRPPQGLAFNRVNCE